MWGAMKRFLVDMGLAQSGKRTSEFVLDCSSTATNGSTVKFEIIGGPDGIARPLPEDAFHQLPAAAQKTLEAYATAQGFRLMA